mgnify:CR=1 FL=1
MINRQAFSRGNQLPHPFAPLGARLRLLGLEYSIRRQELLRNILIIRRLKCFCTTNHFLIAPEVANAATLHPKRHEFRRSERICRRNLRSERSERPSRRRAPRSARPRKCPAPAVRSHGSLFVIFVTALPSRRGLHQMAPAVSRSPRARLVSAYLKSGVRREIRRAGGTAGGTAGGPVGVLGIF